MYSKKDAIDRARIKTVAEYGFDLQVDLGVIMVNHPQSIDLFKPIFPHLVKMRKAALEALAETEKRRF